LLQLHGCSQSITLLAKQLRERRVGGWDAVAVMQCRPRQCSERRSASCGCVTGVLLVRVAVEVLRAGLVHGRGWRQ